MLKKINILIIASVLGFIALSFIQAYLINNTYILKKNAFLKETQKEISKIDDFSPTLDDIHDNWQEFFLNTLADYKINKIQKEEVFRRLQQRTDSLNPYFTKIYTEEIAKRNIPFNLELQKEITSIIILDSIQNDTLFFSNASTPKIHLLGAVFNEKDSHKVSSALWQTEHIFTYNKNGKTTTSSYNLYFGTEDSMNIEGWKKIIFNQMKGLFILSFVIFAFVIGLLFYSIKNLITQKKIADIKTDFVNNITHELKTPLATLSLATKMLKKESVKAQPEVVDKTITTIERQNKRLQKLIDQVLNNSLGYNEIELSKQAINASKYINTVLDDFLFSVEDKKVTLTRDISVSDQEVHIDKFYMTTALLNILENAIKYNSDSLEINCSTSIKNNFTITITDNGMGISEKDQKLIFEKFFRAKNTEIHNVKGLGLGLYYTHQIIKAHNGKIKVKSNEGEGTIFTIKIPLL